MAYRELPLPGRPAPHVACVWTRDPAPVASVGRILPDPCVDVVWVQGDRLVVAGPATRAALAALPAGAAAAGVRFRVGAAGSAVGVPARELRDLNVDLAEVWGPRAAGGPPPPPGRRRHAGRGGRGARRRRRRAAAAGGRARPARARRGAAG